MTIRRVARIAVLACASLLAVSSRSAFASCVVDDQGPCYRYWHTDAVLLGEVREKVLLGTQSVEGFTMRLLPGTVIVGRSRPTVLRPLTARLSRPLSTVTFDLTGLPGRGWIEIRDVSYGLRVGHDREATFAIARDATVELCWSNGDDTTKMASVQIDGEVTRVRLSQLTWKPTQ